MPTKPRASRRRIAEMAFVLRALVDAIETAGSKNVAAHRAALDLVDAFVRGEPAPLEACKAARASVNAACARYARAGSLPPVPKALYAVPIHSLLAMVETGQDHGAHWLAAAAEAVPHEEPAAAAKRVAALRVEAEARCTAIDDTPLARRQPSAETQAAERALLDRARAALTGDALALFDAVGAVRDAQRTRDRALLAARLDELGYPASEAVLAFEETFGGLLVPVTADEDWRDDGLYTLVGPWAVFASGYRPHRRDDDPFGALVPVAYGLQDEVYLLDEQGAPWLHDPTGDTYVVPFGANGAELVTRLVMAAFTYASHAPQGTALWPPVARVATAASALGLTRLFADERTAWWYGPSAIVVVFNGHVYALARTEEALAALRG
jgi:hypothetical protein